MHPDLRCQVERLEYLFNGQSGILRIPAGQCCDMPAAIALFERIDPKVQVIWVHAGELEAMAERDENGWEVFSENEACYRLVTPLLQPVTEAPSPPPETLVTHASP